jgi:hypothetical protein
MLTGPKIQAAVAIEVVDLHNGQIAKIVQSTAADNSHKNCKRISNPQAVARPESPLSIDIDMVVKRKPVLGSMMVSDCRKGSSSYTVLPFVRH